jgi:hypothetical protein
MLVRHCAKEHLVLSIGASFNDESRKEVVTVASNCAALAQSEINLLRIPVILRAAWLDSQAGVMRKCMYHTVQ